MGCFDKPGSSNSQVPVNDITKSPRTKPLKARVLYDYDAADPSELSLLADEVKLFTDEVVYELTISGQ